MKGDAHRSLLWSDVQQFASFGIQFALGIVLTRLLNPYDYGLVAMQGIFFAITGAFVECGMEGALIQKKKCNMEDLSTSFFFSVIMSIALYFILFFAAPVIADFYHTPILCKMFRFSALLLIINAVGIVPKALLQRRLKFKELAVVTMATNLFAGVVALYMAYNGYAYWSLVGQTLLGAFLLTLICLFYVHWIPEWRFSMESLRQLTSFGLPIMFTSLMYSVYNNVYSLVVGRQYNPQKLGLFNRAGGYAAYVSYSLSDMSMRALYPLLSRTQDDLEQLKISALRILHTLAFIAIPINVFLMLKAEDIIRILLTEKWLEMAPLMQILCISSLAYIVSNLHINLFKVIGRTNILFICEMIKKILGIIMLLVTFQYGLIVMVCGLLVYAIMDVLVSSFFVYRFMNITLIEQIKQVHIVTLNALIPVIACVILSSLVDDLYLRFALCFVSYFVIYGLLGLLVKDKAIDFLMGYFKKGES